MAGRRTGQLIRAFVAVTPGENMLSRLTSCIEALKSGPQGDCIRWVRPENLHVTLQFLGNIQENQIDALHTTVTTALAGLAAFELHAGSIGLFPRKGQPRVITTSLIPEDPLIELAAAAEAGVRQAGLPVEDRLYRPHLTLGRINRNAPRPLKVPADRLPPNASDIIDHVSLIRSDLRPDGPIYSTLWSIKLTAEIDFVAS
jgi:2'-5' RNA ligase